VILAGLIAAIFWNLLTWWYGIPSSSSHALIGSFAGAAVAHAYITKGYVPLGEIIEMDKTIQTVMFIVLAPLVGMVISSYVTLSTIQRNIYLKGGIILISSFALYSMFGYFMNQKMDENLMKFLKVDKLKKELAKSPEDEKVKAKYEAASAKYETLKPMLADFKKLEAEGVAKEMAATVDLSEYRDKELMDIVSRFAGMDKAKKDVFYDASKQAELDAVQTKIDACKPLIKQYDSLGHEACAEQIAVVLDLGGKQSDKLKGSFDVNIEKKLTKALDKADNRPLTYSMMAVFAIFLLTYIFVEKIRVPTANKMANMYKRLQLLSSAAFSLGHGGSDAQKVMGIIGAALIANGDISEFKELPNWVPLACYTAIALGTLSGGWKIVKTMGTRITKVTPLEGVGAETAGAITLFMTAQMGIPVSSTHTITGSIIGVGATKRLSAVRWGVTRSLLFAWIITIPISALVAGISYAIIQAF
jgi:phosphate/sulfate permease